MTATKPASGLNAIREFLRLESASGMLLFAAGVLAVVDREQGGRQRLEAAGHKVVALTTSSRLGLLGN